MKALNILTWHVHGSYLGYLSRSAHRFFLPVDEQGMGGRAPHWGSNVIDIPAAEVRNRRFDCILFQSRNNWEDDQHQLLSAEQQKLPRIYLEHDPPRETPTGTRHPVHDPNVLLVHVTHFNALMWDAGITPVRVIDHGVEDHGALWTGKLERGLVVVNNLCNRGRRLGADIFERAQSALPLDLVGMHSADAGGLGEVPLIDLPGFSAPYRFFFHPIRYTSLGLALLEAMMLGMPVVGLATTELPTIIRSGENGFIATGEAALHDAMDALLTDHVLAARWGAAARETALDRFGIARFVSDWNAVLAEVTGQSLREAA